MEDKLVMGAFQQCLKGRKVIYGQHIDQPALLAVGDLYQGYLGEEGVGANKLGIHGQFAYMAKLLAHLLQAAVAVNPVIHLQGLSALQCHI